MITPRKASDSRLPCSLVPPSQTRPSSPDSGLRLIGCAALRPMFGRHLTELARSVLHASTLGSPLIAVDATSREIDCGRVFNTVGVLARSAGQRVQTPITSINASNGSRACAKLYIET